MASMEEQDLLDLATKLGIGSRASDICLRAVNRIRKLEKEASDVAWSRDGGDRMGGSFSDQEYLARHGSYWT
jgi:hypothetical protein